MADRRYGPRPVPPFISDHWLYAVRCTGEPGTAGISCPRCKTSSALELTRDEIPQIGGPPVMVQITCDACQLLGVIVLGPPAATRPPATFLREPTPRSSSTSSTSTPVADAEPQAAADELLLTLSQWQQLGIAPEDMHPASPAAIPRARDERPGRRNEQGLRVYSHREILVAIARQHPNNHTTNTANTNDSATQEGQR